MRERKQSDSPSGYFRDVYRRRVKLPVVRKSVVRTDVPRGEVSWGLAALQNTDGRPAPDWPGCVD